MNNASLIILLIIVIIVVYCFSQESFFPNREWIVDRMATDGKETFSMSKQPYQVRDVGDAYSDTSGYSNSLYSSPDIINSGDDGIYSLKNPENVFFTAPAKYESSQSYRTSNVDYGANLRTHLDNRHPDFNSQDPIGTGCQLGTAEIKENFKHENRVKRDSESANNKTANDEFTSYANENYDDISAQIAKKNNLRKKESSVMHDGDDLLLLNANGETRQPYVYDRYYYSSGQSRLRGLGDHIRGDLPIKSVKHNNGWFDVNPRPNIDLQNGALNVLAGRSEAGDALSKLIYESSGASKTAIGGVDISDPTASNLISSMKVGASAGQGDVSVTAFP